MKYRYLSNFAITRCIAVYQLSMTEFNSKLILRRELPMMVMFKLMLRGNIVMINLLIDHRIIFFNLIDSSAVVLWFTMSVVRISRSVIMCWTD